MSGTALVTGGAGFVGSALVRNLIARGAAVINIDALTYAGSTAAVADVSSSPRYRFEQLDILDAGSLRSAFARYSPSVVFHLAAETHVDRSIDDPGTFVRTNVTGTLNMLEAARSYQEQLPAREKSRFRFVHVSTDEVFGPLGTDGVFTERTAYAPRSPYSASKAGADHLVRAWHATYGLPVIISASTNNFGPFQFPDKLVPLVISAALAGRPLPIYGDGSNIRDWLYVEDHASALIAAAERGTPGETYLIGAGCEVRNIDLVRRICRLLDEATGNAPGMHERLISFVPDRPGHDFRYAVDSGRARDALAWSPAHSFDNALRHTVMWYMQNSDWTAAVMAGRYRGERLGLGAAH